MKCCARLALFLALFLLPSLAFAQLNIVATLPTLGAIAQNVGGDAVRVQTLASSREDPHFLDARPDFVLKLNRADVLIYNGMDLEIGWLPALQKNARNPKIDTSSLRAIDASQFITPLEVPSGKIERSAGDIHPQGNPHYLYSLPNVIAVTNGIAQKLSAIDPPNADTYQKNASNFIAQVQATQDKWEAKFNALPEPKKQIVSYHNAMIYLQKSLGLTQIATVEPKPGIAPNPAHVAKLISTMKSQGIKVILQESYQPTATSLKIAQMTKANVVTIHPGPNLTKQESFIDYADNYLKTLYEALQ